MQPGGIFEHIPAEVFAAIITILLGGLGAAVGLYLRSQGKEKERHDADSKLQWARLEDLSDQMAVVQTAQAVLREAIKSMPNSEVLHTKIAEMEDKLEKKIDSLGTRIERHLERFPCRGGFGCPTTDA